MICFYSISQKGNLGFASLVILSSLMGFSDAYAMDPIGANPEKSTLEIPQETKRLTLDYVNQRLSEANSGNREAQDEMVDLYYKNVYANLLKPEMFQYWGNIQDRCYTDDKYAFYVFNKYDLNAIEELFPGLVKSIKDRAEAGIAAAQNNLAIMYMKGLGGLEKDEGEALRLYTPAADQGFAAAQYNLGWGA